MIERYTREEIGAVWTPQRRMDAWLEVELAATDAWAEEGVVPRDAAAAIRERASFTVEEPRASIRLRAKGVFKVAREDPLLGYDQRNAS